MATKGAGASGKRSYEDFEPFCKWKKEEEHDTLEVHLHGFKKDQLRVQINTLGVLTISGSHPVDETRWTRFLKEIKVSKDCKTDEIRAKFSSGILYVVMPKGSSQDQQIKKTNSHTTEKPKMSPENVSYKSMDGKPNVAGSSAALGDDIENANRLSTTHDNKIMMNSLKGRFSRLIRGKPMIVSIAAVTMAAAVVLAGIFVMKKYQAPDHIQD